MSLQNFTIYEPTGVEQPHRRTPRRERSSGFAGLSNLRERSPSVQKTRSWSIKAAPWVTRILTGTGESCLRLLKSLKLLERGPETTSDEVAHRTGEPHAGDLLGSSFIQAPPSPLPTLGAPYHGCRARGPSKKPGEASLSDLDRALRRVARGRLEGVRSTQRVTYALRVTRHVVTGSVALPGALRYPSRCAAYNATLPATRHTTHVTRSARARKHKIRTVKTCILE